MSKMFDECVQTLDEMAINDYDYQKDRLILRKLTNLLDRDQISILTSQVAALMKRLEEKEVEHMQMVLSNPRGCETCEIEHEYGDCMSIAKHVNYMGGYNSQNNQPRQ